VDLPFAIPDSNGGGGLRRLQARTADHDPRFRYRVDVGRPGAPISPGFFGISAQREVGRRFGEEEHVLHSNGCCLVVRLRARNAGHTNMSLGRAANRHLREFFRAGEETSVVASQNCLSRSAMRTLSGSITPAISAAV
jgi:hypothetical protein